jgi:glycosyltransferase involved in cell wall biosynthesis
MLAQMSGRSVSPVTVPWSIPAPITPSERIHARVRLGIAPESRVALYAGNLDAYQGLDDLLAGLAQYARVDRTFTWLVATQSPTNALLQSAASFGMEGRLLVTSLADEVDRRLVHAAADAALVPRGSAGGLPIKLLDALARGVPVIATRTACAGLEPPVICVDGSPASWSAALRRTASAPPGQQAQAGPEYVRHVHTPARFVSELLAH